MEKYILWLIMLECTNLQKIKLMRNFSNEKEIYDKFDYIIKTYLKGYENFVNYNREEELKKAILIKEDLKYKNINFITINDPSYPESLRNIKEPPYVLFYVGDIALLNKRKVGIVGARKNSSYGENSTREIVKELVRNDICVVSGGAKGIDSIVHDTCLRFGGNTIAVLGCGIDVCYPVENRNLFNRIRKDNLIISEFLPGTKPYAYNFPRRNRIISGLSELVVVTEAAEKSGSLITVTYALEQGKEVIVVPQSIFSKTGYGANILIRDGAHIYTSIDDLYLLLEIEKIKNIDKKEEKCDLIDNEILKFINDKPTHIDEIFIKSQVDRKTLYGLLFELQIKNEIVSLPGEYYARVR